MFPDNNCEDEYTRICIVISDSISASLIVFKEFSILSLFKLIAREYQAVIHNLFNCKIVILFPNLDVLRI